MSTHSGEKLNHALKFETTCENPSIYQCHIRRKKFVVINPAVVWDKSHLLYVYPRRNQLFDARQRDPSEYHEHHLPINQYEEPSQRRRNHNHYFQLHRWEGAEQMARRRGEDSTEERKRGEAQLALKQARERAGTEKTPSSRDPNPPCSNGGPNALSTWSQGLAHAPLHD